MIRVHVSSVIGAPVETVWAAIRDYDGLPSWHPSIGASRIDDGKPADCVGCIRSLTLAEGGGIVRERLLTLSDRDHACTYTILEAPLPISNYVATLQCAPITDGNRTFIEWMAEFDTPEPEAMTETIGQGVFQAGFNALKQRFGG